MKIQTFDNVWDAIEDRPEAAQNMTLRCDLMLALEEHIKRQKMTQAQAAPLFGVTQPRVSDLVRGKIELRISSRAPQGGDTHKKTATR